MVSRGGHCHYLHKVFEEIDCHCFLLSSTGGFKFNRERNHVKKTMFTMSKK